MYREPRRLSHVRKCRECRRDKRKCLPLDRVWPGQKCEGCLQYGYDCGRGLSAKEQRAISRSIGQVAGPQSQRTYQIAERVSDGTGVAEMHVDHPVVQEEYGLATGIQDHSNVNRINTVSAPAQSPRYSSRTRSPGLRLIEPSDLRIRNHDMVRLEDRLRRLWANAEMYDPICSPRMGRTVSDLFSYHFQQIAATEALVFNSLFAFSAADSAINVMYPSRASAERLTCTFYDKAVGLLRARLKLWSEDRRASNVPLLYSIFLLAIYGLCADDPDTIRLMTDLLRDVRKSSAVFPLGLEYHPVEPIGWRCRVYLADDPEDPGITLGHDTSLFDHPRAQFEQEVEREGQEDRITEVLT